MKQRLAYATLIALTTSVQAQQAGTSDADKATFGGITFTASLRTWWATFDAATLDAQVVVGPGGSPLIQTFTKSNQSSKLLPIVAVSATIDAFTLAASLSPDTKFDNSSVPSGKIGRREYDISLGYSVVPGLVVSAIYKGGRITDAYTTNAQNLLGFKGDVKLDGWLLGIFGNAPIELEGISGLRLYGNVAAGKGRSRTFEGRSNLNYLVSEVGFSWPFGQSWSMGTFKGGNIQVGYRAQTVNSDGDNFTFDPSTRAVVATAPTKVSSTTRGPVIGLTFAF